MAGSGQKQPLPARRLSGREGSVSRPFLPSSAVPRWPQMLYEVEIRPVRGSNIHDLEQPSQTDEHAGAGTRASRVMRARPQELYAAFPDPAALIDWLPPAAMTGEIHEFDAQVGGGYRMSLFYPPDECFLARRDVRQGGHGQGAVRGTGASPEDRRSGRLRHPIRPYSAR